MEGDGQQPSFCVRFVFDCCGVFHYYFLFIRERELSLSFFFGRILKREVGVGISNGPKDDLVAWLSQRCRFFNVDLAGKKLTMSNEETKK